MNERKRKESRLRWNRSTNKSTHTIMHRHNLIHSYTQLVCSLNSRKKEKTVIVIETACINYGIHIHNHHIETDNDCMINRAAAFAASDQVLNFSNDWLIINSILFLLLFCFASELLCLIHANTTISTIFSALVFDCMSIWFISRVFFSPHWWK